MRENEVEKQFVEAVRAAGGQALKFTSQSMNGVPDRLVLLLGGKCAFVELKAPGKQMRILEKTQTAAGDTGLPGILRRPPGTDPACYPCIASLETGRAYPTGNRGEDSGDAGSYAATRKYTKRGAGNTGTGCRGGGDAQMKFIPHDYQSYCTEYIKTHPVAALFLDMGLG